MTGAPEVLRRHAGLLASVALVVTFELGFIGAELGIVPAPRR